MALQQTNIQTQNVQVFVGPSGVGIPGNLIATDPYVECILELSSLKQTRATETYACMSSNASFTSAGTIEKDPLTLKTLYSEDGGGNGGYDAIQDAFETNSQVAVLIQFDNGTTGYMGSVGVPPDGTTGGTGTTIYAEAIVTSFELSFEKDKLVETNFELAYQGDVVIEPAA